MHICQYILQLGNTQAHTKYPKGLEKLSKFSAKVLAFMKQCKCERIADAWGKRSVFCHLPSSCELYLCHVLLPGGQLLFTVSPTWYHPLLLAPMPVTLSGLGCTHWFFKQPSKSVHYETTNDKCVHLPSHPHSSQPPSFSSVLGLTLSKQKGSRLEMHQLL